MEVKFTNNNTNKSEKLEVGTASLKAESLEGLKFELKIKGDILEVEKWLEDKNLKSIGETAELEITGKQARL